MSIKRILLDSNAYLRLANSFHPLLHEPFGKDQYALYLIPEFQKEFDKNPRLANKFGWVNQGQRPNARHVRAWEVGRRNIIDEANEQREKVRDVVNLLIFPTNGYFN
jgi:hypothetical protein